MLQTPVVLIMFNRPNHTRRVFEIIAQARPRTLFLVADGPRPDRADDAERCAEVRRIVEQVDWDCQVERIYAETNMGCGYRVSSGISRVFEQVEEAIILEDDCIPQADFFRFCTEMLSHYRDDERVMMISGTNPLGPRPDLAYSYYFALPTVCWGWATWSRAWNRHYDLPMRTWPELRSAGWLEQLYLKPRYVRYWQERFDRLHSAYGQPNLTTWDYQWFFSMWAQHALAIFPAANLVSNIGYGTEATHTITSDPSQVYFPTAKLSFPLRHPPYLRRDTKADDLRMEQIMAEPPLVWKLLIQIYKHVPASARRVISGTVKQALGLVRRPRHAAPPTLDNPR